MRVFITGATGVIGRRVVPLLVAAGHQVSAVGRTAEKRAALEHMGASAVAADLFTPESLHSALHGHEVVINLATRIPPLTRMFLPGAFHENDRIRRFASANLCEAALAAGAGRFIQESFALTYPDRGDEWIDEHVPVMPIPYNRTVLDAEASALRFARSGRAGVVLRFAALYGPGDPQTDGLISFARRGWAALPGAPDAFLPTVSQDDAASAVVAALGVDAGIYNVVDDEPLRRRECFDALASALGVAPPKLPPAWTKYLMGSLGETLARSLRLSNRKLRGASAWTPQYPSVRKGWRAVVKATQV